MDMSSVELWLQPLPDSDEPCGKDLEYDNDFLELFRVVQGKPETQFAPGEPPDWGDVLERSEALLGRTRDLRIALLWARASVNLRGFSALSPGLRLIEGLISNFWETLHPLLDPDDGDPYARANALAVLPDTEGLLGDLRQSVLFSVRGSGAIRVRSVLIALNQMGAKADETPLSREQLAQMLASAVAENSALGDQPQAALADVKSLSAALDERFGGEAAPDLRPLVDLLKSIQSVMPSAVADTEVSDGSDSVAGHSEARPKAALGSVSSREDAVRAIDMVCEFLDRTEPTNPAQLLLRRARRLINHNFLQLIKELAPEALNEAARVMGVDPDSVSLDSSF